MAFSQAGAPTIQCACLDVGARNCVAVLGGHEGWLRALAALPDGRLASASDTDPLIRVWALTAPGSPEDAAAAAAAARGVVVKAGPAVAGPAGGKSCCLM